MNAKFLLISIFILSFKFLSAQDNAKSIFLKATKGLTAENIEMSMTIDVTDDKGHLKSKDLTVLMAKFDDEKKTKVVWRKPERAKGTTIVITEVPGETGTIEVFTPSNGKTRKLKATDSNMNMVGSEFNMMSFANFNAAELKYQLLNDTTINNVACYKIKVSGASAKGNTGAVLVIRKDSNSIILATRFDDKNKAISQTQLSDYKNIDGDPGKMYPTHIVTKDYDKNKDIVISISDVKARKDLTKNAFTL